MYRGTALHLPRHNCTYKHDAPLTHTHTIHSFHSLGHISVRLGGNLVPGDVHQTPDLCGGDGVEEHGGGVAEHPVAKVGEGGLAVCREGGTESGVGGVGE